MNRARGFTVGDAMLLASVEANLKNVTEAVGEIRSGLTAKVDRLEREKVSYEHLTEHFGRLEKTFERMEHTLSARLDTVEEGKASRKDYDEARHDHEKRLRGLEQFRWKALGIVTGISGLVSFLNHKFLHLIEGK